MSRAPILALFGALAASACADDVGVVTTSDGTTSDGTYDVPGTSGTFGGDELGASEEVSGRADTTAAPDTTDADTTAGVDPTADGTTSSATTGGEDTSTGDPPQRCDDADSCTVEHCGTISNDETWGPDVVHVLTCHVYVEGPANPTLTILDGTTVLAEPGTALVMGQNEPGRLEILGAARGVLVSAAQPLPGGEWEGMSFREFDTGSSVSGAVIERSGTWEGALTLHGVGAPDIVVTDTTIRDGPASGVLAYGRTVELHACNVVDNGESGIVLLGGTSGSRIQNTSVTGNGASGLVVASQNGLAETGAVTGSIFTQNAEAPVRIHVDEVRKLDSSASFSGNGQPIVMFGAAYTSGVWHALDEVYAVGDILVEILTNLEPVTIEIEAGTTILNGGTMMWNSASVVAHGTEDAPVRFVGGMLAMGSAPAGVPSELDHVVIEDALDLWLDGEVHISNSVVRNALDDGIVVGGSSEVQITGTLVENNAGYGVVIHGSLTAPFVDNVITGNEIAMLVDAHVPTQLDASSLMAGNLDDRVHVQGDVEAGDTTWPALGVPYRVEGSVAVRESAVLSIGPGATIELDGLQSLSVGDDPGLSPGGLVAVGTADAPIVFRSASPTPGPGDWAGILVRSFALPTTLEHCVVQHAGGDGFDGAIVVQTDAVTISSCTIADSASWGIYQDGATATLSGNTFSGNLAGDVFP